SEKNSQEGLAKTEAIMMASYNYSLDCSQYFELIVYMERPEFQTKVMGHKEVSTRLQEFFSNHIREQQRKGYMRKDLDPIIANYLAWGSSMGIMQFLDSKRTFLENVEQISQKQLMESFVRIMVRGMAC
ncbi:MAG: hypothetical protein AAGF77_13490, partial [Bacteroidota bacterium]